MKYLMTFSYDGTNYHGYQIQPNKKTIQENIEEKLTQINSNKQVKITATGRTDAHVHAINQKAHFYMDKKIDTSILKNSLNKLINDDIYIKNIIEVDDNFHARFDVLKKEYMYIINIGEYNPIEKNYVYQYNNDLDINKMKEAIKYFIGTHNFKSFTKVDDKKENFVRTIYEANIKIEDNKIYINFIGNGFLRYMVRNMVGTLINIGESKIEPNKIKEMICKEDRKVSGVTAPPNGLYLKNIYY